jgi:hypothetical protein
LAGRAAAAGDAGLTPQQALAMLVASGLPRLEPALLEERFRLRLTLLTRVDAGTCAALVRQRESGDWLDLLTEGEATRWAALSEAALAAGAEAHEPIVSVDDVRALEQQVSRSSRDFLEATDSVRAADRVPDEQACRAERVRLTTALGLPAPDRLLLLRGWASGY